MPTGRQRSSLFRPSTGFATLARRLGGVAVIVVATVAVLGPPVDAQLPTLPPITTVPPDPATTTTTLLPPLVPTEELLEPTPGSTAPAILPLPAAAPARRTTTYKPPPVPPSTPARAAPPARTPRTTAASATPADVEGADTGEGDAGFGAELPFAAEEGEVPTGDDTMELGIQASARDQVGTLASVAAGLIAIVLFGLALWLRGEVHRSPALPPW